MFLLRGFSVQSRLAVLPGFVINLFCSRGCRIYIDAAKCWHSLALIAFYLLLTFTTIYIAITIALLLCIDSVVNVYISCCRSLFVHIHQGS